MADNRFLEDYYLETDYGYVEDGRIESPVHGALGAVHHACKNRTDTNGVAEKRKR